jgi:cellulose synthase/poly-beta-1,6-N-acetylglucosamine synthase-like glycosyltransferase
VLVVCRGDDAPTREAAGAFPFARTVEVRRPGVVAALSAGLLAAAGDVIATTDDDAVPRRDWLARIDAWFAEPAVGGVGGRDVVHRAGRPVEEPRESTVGRVQWWGRVRGNHHLGSGPPRDVDVLKGVNMAVRAEALRVVGFDQRLRGGGAQVHYELALGLALRRRGWRLVYDPEVLVDHHPAERFDADRREAFSATAVADMVHNETLALLEFLPRARRPVFLVWAVLVGTSAAPGLLQCLRSVRRDGRVAVARLAASQRGRRDGLRTWRGRQPARPRAAAT